MKFELSDLQVERANKWLKKRYKKTIKLEKKDKTFIDQNPYAQADWKLGYPSVYSVTYSFTPIGIGLICKVHYDPTKETLDITEYDKF